MFLWLKLQEMSKNKKMTFFSLVNRYNNTYFENYIL